MTHDNRAGTIKYLATRNLFRLKKEKKRKEISTDPPDDISIIIKMHTVIFCLLHRVI